MSLSHPDFTLADHRGIGWPDVDADGFRERIRSVIDLDAELASYLVRIHRTNGRAILDEGCHRVTFPSGAVQAERHLNVVTLDPDSGMAMQIDFFGTDQLDEAEARYERIAADAEADDRFGNLTALLAARADFFASHGRWDRFRETLSSDLVVEDGHGARLAHGPDSVTESTGRRLGFGVASRRVLAARGERLALLELRDPAGDGEALHRFAVVQSGVQLQLTRVTLYGPDELIRAAEHFDQVFHDTVDPALRPVAEAVARYLHANRVLDRELAMQTTSEGYSFTDHRPLGYPALDRAGYLAAIDAVTDAHGILIGTGDYELSQSGLVSRMRNYQLDGDDLVERQHAVALLFVSHGRVEADELFADGDIDAARRRLHELSNAAAGHDAGSAS